MPNRRPSFWLTGPTIFGPVKSLLYSRTRTSKKFRPYSGPSEFGANADADTSPRGCNLTFRAASALNPEPHRYPVYERNWATHRRALLDEELLPPLSPTTTTQLYLNTNHFQHQAIQLPLPNFTHSVGHTSHPHSISRLELFQKESPFVLLSSFEIEAQRLSFGGKEEQEQAQSSILPKNRSWLNSAPFLKRSSFWNFK